MDNSYTQILFQLFLAAILGSIIGLEREYKKKEAGLQTYTLVVLGACLFTIIGLGFVGVFTGKASVVFEPFKIIVAIATGIGFIGGGVIIHREFKTEGITTAAGLWLAAGIGMAVGAGLYFIAIAATVFAVIVLAGYGLIERKLFGRSQKD